MSRSFSYWMLCDENKIGTNAYRIPHRKPKGEKMKSKNYSKVSKATEDKCENERERTLREWQTPAAIHSRFQQLEKLKLKRKTKFPPTSILTHPVVLNLKLKKWSAGLFGSIVKSYSSDLERGFTLNFYPNEVLILVSDSIWHATHGFPAKTWFLFPTYTFSIASCSIFPCVYPEELSHLDG